jgi:murein DD-endopeptidase MepM/ murein hydrolase activator NlpD
MHTAIILLLTLLVPQTFMGLVPVDKDFYLEVLPQQSTQLVINGASVSIDRENWLLDIRYPVDNYAITTSGWGSRDINDCSRCSGFHKGLDFTPGRGAPVYAAMDGTIVKVENSGEYGVHVIIDHLINEDLVYTTVYAHLQVSSVTKRLQLDNNIKKGDLIGYVGSTGLSTGPHLHFEIRINGRHVDPLQVLQQNIVETIS